MKRYGVFLFLISISTSVLNGYSIVDHDLHLSKCEVFYDQKTTSIHITLHIFIDDLEKALRTTGHNDLRICTEREDAQADTFIGEYIDSKLKINVDGIDLKMNFLGKEISDDLFAAWCYLEIADVHPQQTIIVSYDLLMEIFNDQRNIVSVEFDKERNSYFLFDKKSFEGKLEL